MQPAEKRQSGWRTLYEWVKVIVVALLIAYVVRTYVGGPFIVVGASMDPTFGTGQFLIVDYVSYHFEQPHRGDVIVFQYPLNPSTDYIKRIIGLPGEAVDINDGKITITNAAHPDGFPLDEPYVESMHSSHETQHTVLGATEYFAMGDNRAQSSDSRVWGPVDRHFIIGRPIVRLFPVAAAAILPGEHNQ